MKYFIVVIVLLLLMLTGCSTTITETQTISKTQTRTTALTSTETVTITTPRVMTITKTVVQALITTTPRITRIPFIVTEAITWTVIPDKPDYVYMYCEEFYWQATIKNLSRQPKTAYIRITRLDEQGFVHGSSGRSVDFAPNEEKVVTGHGRHCSSQGVSYANAVLEVSDSKLW